MKVLGRRFWKTVQHWIDVDGTFVAAAVTFYAALALFPLFLVLMSVFGWLLASSRFVQDWEARFLDIIANDTSAQFAEQVAVQLEQIQSNANVSGSISIVTFLLLSVALFVNLERAFQRIWQSPSEPVGILLNLRRILMYRLQAFLMLFGIVLIVLLNFAVIVALEAIARFVSSWVSSEMLWWFAQLSASILLNALMFTAIFQTVPREKVLWRHAIQGGVLTACLWEVGRFVLASLVISERYNAFGVVGAFLALLLWLFYGMNTILFGATYVCVTSRVLNKKRKNTRDSD